MLETSFFYKSPKLWEMCAVFRPVEPVGIFMIRPNRQKFNFLADRPPLICLNKTTITVLFIVRYCYILNIYILIFKREYSLI